MKRDEKKDCYVDFTPHSRKTQSLNGTNQDTHWYYYPKAGPFLERWGLYNAEQAGATNTGKSLSGAED
jgi:hypothetical protein